MVYGSDWKAEFEFLVDCCDVFLQNQVRTIFEPACGTGRLLYRLAQQGYDVSGVDLNALSVEYCNQRLARLGFPETAFVGDMCQFSVSQPIDLAFNLVSSFRHVVGKKQALDHLRCVARCLKSGGIYVLGFHLSPTAAAPSESEQWSATRGRLTVHTRMDLVERDWQKKIERFQISFEVVTPSSKSNYSDIVEFQMYTLRDFQDLLETCGHFMIEAAYDFHYEIESPIDLSDSSEDVVFILRKQFIPS